MKRASANYSIAMNKQFRDRAYAIIILGLINKDAQNEAEVTSQVHYLSDSTNVFEQNWDSYSQYATMEQNVFKADGSQYFAPYESQPDIIQRNVCVLTPGLKGSLTFSFDTPKDIVGFSINFTEFYPTEFRLTTDNGIDTTYKNDSAEWFCNDEFNGVKTVTITPISFVNGDNKRMRIKTITMGVGVMATNHEIENLSLDDEVSFTSEELPSITGTLNCVDYSDSFNVDNPNSYLPYLQTGQQISSWIGQTLADGSIEYIKMPILYLTSWSSNNGRVSFTGKDRLSMLTKTYSLGNTIHSRTLYDEAVSVFTDAGLEPDEYAIDDSLRDITIVNPMPERTHAQCLQLIANASRCILRQTADGVIKLVANFENIIDPSELNVVSNTHAAWSKPQNIRSGASCVYADMTQNFFSADGSMRFMPRNTDYLQTGYVSSSVADSEGNFAVTPSLSMKLPATFSYFGVIIKFAGNLPKQMRVMTFNDGTKKLDIVVEPTDLEYYLAEDFLNFDKITFEFPQGSPNDRVLINKITFGQITDYVLKKEDMMESPVGTLEEKVRDVSVRLCTYVESDNPKESPKLVDDNVYYKHTINFAGTSVVFENPLIHTKEHAQQVAEWLGNYYNNNVTYQVSYRGDPRIDGADLIFMENDYLNNLQVDVEKHSLKFNGALSGTLNLRRALKMS